MQKSETGRPRLRWGLCGPAVIVLIAFFYGARPAAATEAQAEALIRQGVELRTQGHDERALPLFQKAYEILDTPRTAGQLGLAELAVGYWLEADQHLGEALQSPDHPWIVKNRKALEDSRTQARKNISQIAIGGTPVGATVTVNHQPAGALPLADPVRVAKGKVEIEVSSPGYTTVTESRVAVGGERQEVTVSLEKAAAMATPKEPPKEAPVAIVPPSSGAPAPSPAAPSSEDSAVLRTRIGWGLGIAAGVTLVGAVVETIVWQKDRSDFNDATKGCDSTKANYGAAGCSSLYNSLHTAQTVAIVGYAATAALAGGAAIVLLTGRKPDRSEARLTCAPALGSAFVSCLWSF